MATVPFAQAEQLRREIDRLRAQVAELEEALRAREAELRRLREGRG